MSLSPARLLTRGAAFRALLSAPARPAPGRFAAPPTPALTLTPRFPSTSLHLAERRRGLAGDASSSSSSNNADSQQQQQQQQQPPSPPTDSAELKQLQAKVAELTEQLSSAKEKQLYALAEAENARRIAAKDVENARQFAIQSFAKSLLDVADNLDRAIKTFPKARAEDPELKPLLDGVVGTEKELLKAFKAAGLEPFGAVGDVCDPHKYEALFQVPDASKAPNTVVEVLRRGFVLKGRVLRPAQVGAATKA